MANIDKEFISKQNLGTGFVFDNVNKKINVAGGNVDLATKVDGESIRLGKDGKYYTNSIIYFDDVLIENIDRFKFSPKGNNPRYSQKKLNELLENFTGTIILGVGRTDGLFRNLAENDWGLKSLRQAGGYSEDAVVNATLRIEVTRTVEDASNNPNPTWWVTQEITLIHRRSSSDLRVLSRKTFRRTSKQDQRYVVPSAWDKAYQWNGWEELPKSLTVADESGLKLNDKALSVDVDNISTHILNGKLYAGQKPIYVRDLFRLIANTKEETDILRSVGVHPIVMDFSYINGNGRAIRGSTGFPRLKRDKPNLDHKTYHLGERLRSLYRDTPENELFTIANNAHRVNGTILDTPRATGYVVCGDNVVVYLTVSIRYDLVGAAPERSGDTVTFKKALYFSGANLSWRRDSISTVLAEVLGNTAVGDSMEESVTADNMEGFSKWEEWEVVEEIPAEVIAAGNQAITASNGLEKVGNNVRAKVDGSTITVNSNGQLQANVCAGISTLPTVEWKAGTKMLVQQGGVCKLMDVREPAPLPKFVAAETWIKEYKGDKSDFSESEAITLAETTQVGATKELLVKLKNHTQTRGRFGFKLVTEADTSNRFGSDSGATFKVTNIDTAGFDMKGATLDTGSVTDGTSGKHIMINNFPANDFILLKLTVQVTKVPVTRRTSASIYLTSLGNTVAPPAGYDPNSMTGSFNGINITWRNYYMSVQYSNQFTSLSRTFRLAQYDTELPNKEVLYRVDGVINDAYTVEFAEGSGMPPRQVGVYNPKLIARFQDNSTLTMNPTITIQ